MSPTDSEVIILGASARAAAHSAQRASLRSWCCDLFADEDLRSVAETADRCPPGDYPWALVAWLDRSPLPRDAPVVLTGALENHPRLLAAVERRRGLWTPDAASTQAARDPMVFASLSLPESVVPCATAVDSASIARWHAGEAGPGAYLSKPRSGAAGRGIRRGGRRPDRRRGCYCQAYVDGVAVGAVYHAERDGVQCLGVTRQLIGEAAFGVAGFRYCGSVGPLALTASQGGGLAALGEALAQRCGLTGLFGVDAIIDRCERVRPVEVNPRYTAGIEVLERAGALPVLGRFGATGRRSSVGTETCGNVAGKAVIHARDDGIVPSLTSLVGPSHVADVPVAGSFVRRGDPICTVFASAQNDAACHAVLQRRAAQVYEGMGQAVPSPVRRPAGP